MLKRLRELLPVQIACELAGETGAPIYLVGGAVRDALSGISFAGDCDFAVVGGFDRTVAEFTRRIKGHSIPWDFKQTRVVYRNSEGEHISVDFSQSRGADMAADLALRDFTVNAMAVAVPELLSGSEPQVLDPLGGRNDIARRRIRMCSEQAFDDDPLRMLRAVRFARQLGYAIDPATLASCARRYGLIKKVSTERIKKELFTILNLPEPGLSLRQLLDTGLLECLLPEISGWADFVQCPPHEFTLLEHSLKTVEQVSQTVLSFDAGLTAGLAEVLEEGVTRRSLLFFTAFLHDSGKPAAAQMSGGKLCFHGHEQEGGRTNRRIAERLGLGRRCRRMVEQITHNHMRLLHLTLLDKVSERAKLRFVRDCADAALETVLLSLSDLRATTGDPASREQVQAAQSLAGQLLAKAAEPLQALDRHLLTGTDIIDELGIGAGPAVGAIIAELHQAERQGCINTREEALTWLKTRKP